MKPPVEEIRISAKGKERLVRLKKRTGMGHWNHLCRVAYCRSLSAGTVPLTPESGDGGLRIEWKTFAGQLSEELACLNAWRAVLDGIDITEKESLAEHFRAHLERGIEMICSSDSLEELVKHLA